MTLSFNNIFQFVGKIYHKDTILIEVIRFDSLMINVIDDTIVVRNIEMHLIFGKCPIKA